MKALEMCAVLFASNSLKISVLFDTNSGKVCSKSLKMSVLFDLSSGKV